MFVKRDRALFQAGPRLMLTWDMSQVCPRDVPLKATVSADRSRMILGRNLSAGRRRLEPGVPAGLFQP